MWVATCTHALSDTPALRIAFYHTELTRNGPGLLLRDIQRGEDEQVKAVTEIIHAVAPDILVMWGIDWDFENLALHALRDTLSERGTTYPYAFSAKPNRGQPTGLDLNGDGITYGPEDAQSFGEFTGENGLAVLSRWPIATSEMIDFTPMLWRDLPGALLPWPGQPDGVEDILRLSSTAHWVLPIDTETEGRIWIATFAASTPVFDGPEDRNGRRNHDELRLWRMFLDGDLATPAPDGLVLAGHANLDPTRGDGRREAIVDLLAHDALQDAQPKGAAQELTVDWKRDDLENMRLSYILPTRTWKITGSGVYWPEPESAALELAQTASRHRLVWVDLERRP